MTEKSWWLEYKLADRIAPAARKQNIMNAVLRALSPLIQCRNPTHGSHPLWGGPFLSG